MRKSKKQLLRTLMACGLVVSVAAGGTVAYLTDAETATNTFTVGKVKIDLEEPGYPGNDSDEVKNIIPNQEIEKDPQIENTGNNDALVFLRVEVPQETFTDEDDGTWEQKKQDLFKLKGISDQWELLRTETTTDADGKAKTSYVYGYKKTLAKGSTTDKLFRKVQLKNAVESDLSGNVEDVIVTACAIQATDIPDVDLTLGSDGNLGKDVLDQVYTIFLNQSGDQKSRPADEGDRNQTGKLGKISYVLDGGTLADGSLTEYGSSDYGYTPPEPTKEGFVFAGWSPASIPTDSAGNITFTANWDAVDIATTLLDGPTLNVRMKTLAGDTSPTCDAQNTSITAIQYSSVAPTAAVMADPNSLVSTEDSGHPVYMWYDDGTIKWWSEAKTVNAGTSLQKLCRYMLNLTDISGLANFNTENVTSTSGMFSSNYRYLMTLADITPLANWDTSNLTDASQMFYCCKLLTDITPVANWDTSNIKNMEYLFSNCSSLSDITPLEKWNTENVTNMGNLFAGAVGIEMSLSDITPLANWNITSVTDISYIFYRCTSLADITPLANWNTESAKTMEHAFGETAITDLVPLANWNVKNVTNMLEMFLDCKSLADASAINDWDISKQTFIDGMFQGCSVHASFTNRPGYWGYLGQYQDAT